MGCAAGKPNHGLGASGVSLHWQGADAPGSQKPTCFVGAHDDMANGVCAGFEPGEWLSCAEDKTVALTDWQAGQVVQQWRAHERGVNRVSSVPAIGCCLSGSRDTTVRLWRRGKAEAVATLTGHELSVSALAANAQGTQALSGSRDYSLRLWDLPTASLSHRCQISRNVVTCLAWVPGEAHLVAQGSEDLRLRLWDVRTLSKPHAILEGYVYFPLAVDCQGPYVVTGSNGFDRVGCELRVWDRRTNRQVHELKGHEQSVTGLCLLHNTGSVGSGAAGQPPLLAASGGKDGEIRVWDVAAGGESLCSVRLGEGEGVTCLAAALGKDSAACLYASSTSGRVHALQLEGVPETWSLRVVASGGDRVY